MRRMPSWSQKIEARTFPADFCTRNFWCGVNRNAAIPLIVALPPGHSDITRFRPSSPIAPDRKLFGSRLTKKIPQVAQTTGTVDVFDRVQAFRDSLRGELPHVQIFMIDGPNPLTWGAQLLSYWFSRNTAVFQD